MTGWLECGRLVCWLQTWVKRLDVELVADLGEAMLVFSAGEGARCRWCVTRYLVELCCVVGSRWLLELVWYASVEWMWWGCCLPSWSCVSSGWPCIWGKVGICWDVYPAINDLIHHCQSIYFSLFLKGNPFKTLEGNPFKTLEGNPFKTLEESCDGTLCCIVLFANEPGCLSLCSFKAVGVW